MRYLGFSKELHGSLAKSSRYRSYLWLGCPHGCNEGMRTAQADFLRIKARTLFALMHRINPEIFTQTVVDQVKEYNIQNLVDVMHAITGFCKVDTGISMMHLLAVEKTCSYKAFE